MRKNRKIAPYKVGVLLLILVLCLSLMNCLGFSRDVVQPQFSEFADKFGSLFHTYDFTFEFVHLSDTLMNRIREEGVEFPSKNDEVKELIEQIGDKRVYFLTVTALEIASFRADNFVFVQSGQQFNINTIIRPDFYVFQGKDFGKVYPGTVITGILLLPSSFNPTIPATIWYDEQKLGSFVINAEHRGLLPILRKPVDIVLDLDFEKEASGGSIIEVVMEDEYGLSTKSDGLINCQLYSLKYNSEEERYEEKELLYEKEIDVHANDFRLDYPFRREKVFIGRPPGKKEEKVFVYRWREKLKEEDEVSTRHIDGKQSSLTTRHASLGSFLFADMPVARLIISFTLPTGERLIATMNISRREFEKGA